MPTLFANTNAIVLISIILLGLLVRALRRADWRIAVNKG